MVDGVSVQSVCVINLAAFVSPEDRSPYGRCVIEQPVVCSAPSRGYDSIVCVPKGNLKERDVLQDGLCKAYVPKVKVERDRVIAPPEASRYFPYRGTESHDSMCARAIFGASGKGNPPIKTIEPRRLASAITPGLTISYCNKLFDSWACSAGIYCRVIMMGGLPPSQKLSKAIIRKMLIVVGKVPPMLSFR